MREYDLIADWYARDRTHLTGVPEVQALTATLSPGAAVLDVGCGNGIPLTKLLVDAGFNVLGVDSATRMVEQFRTNLPGTPVMCSPIQTTRLPIDRFDAAIAWGVIFHLTHGDQALAFAKVARALKPGGRFLFTSGDRGDKDDNGIEGAPMNGVPFHYWSLTREGYRELLRQHGLRLIEVHQDGGQNTYYLAEKSSL
jgi:SAM-dependent methyltransferase